MNRRFVAIGCHATDRGQRANHPRLVDLSPVLVLRAMASHQSSFRSDHGPGTRAVRIAVQRIDIPGRWLVMPIEHVAYAFLGSAASHRIIEAPWASDRVLTPTVVYVRTIKGGLFRAGSATLDALRQRLDPERFVSIHRLVTVNVHRLVEVDLGGNVSRVGVLVDADVEFLLVSRRRLRSLRELLGLPKRG